MEDLNSDTSWFQYCELKVDNLTIEKRKTDKKQKRQILYMLILSLKISNIIFNAICTIDWNMNFITMDGFWNMQFRKMKWDGKYQSQILK